MADVTWVQDSDLLQGFGKSFKVSCKVRNELNNLRDKDNIFYTTLAPDDDHPLGQWPGVPSQPRIFPIGNWRITSHYKTDRTYLHPIVMITDAHQKLEKWEVKNGLYVRGTGIFVEDYALRIHWSKESDFTQGCIRIDTEEEIILFARLWDETVALISDKKDKWISFEVVAK